MAVDDSKVMKPGFIVGVPRSGTTLLINLLGQHPLIAPLYETRFLRNLLVLCRSASWYYGNTVGRQIARVAEPMVRASFQRACNTYERKAVRYSVVPDEGNGLKQRYESFPFGESYCIHYRLDELVKETSDWLASLRLGKAQPEEVYSSARLYVDRLFAIHCARMNKPNWINKTPGLLTYLDTLPKLFPHSKCIHIVRDGRDVAVSNLSLSWGPKTVRAAARRWKKLIMDGRKAARASVIDYLEIRYEDVVEDSQRMLRQALRFFELEDNIVSTMVVTRGRKDAWRNKLSAEDRRVFAQEAGDLLIEFGYAHDDSWV